MTIIAILLITVLLAPQSPSRSSEVPNCGFTLTFRMKDDPEIKKDIVQVLLTCSEGHCSFSKLWIAECLGEPPAFNVFPAEFSTGEKGFVVTGSRRDRWIAVEASGLLNFRESYRFDYHLGGDSTIVVTGASRLTVGDDPVTKKREIIEWVPVKGRLTTIKMRCGLQAFGVE